MSLRNVNFLIVLTIMGCITDRDKSELPPIDTSILPMITITDVEDISNNTAVIKSDLVSNGGSTIISYGICWCLEAETWDGHLPTIEDKKSRHYSYFNRSFKSGLLNLKPGTRYCVRSYAENNKGINYSQQVNFDTRLMADPNIKSVIDQDNNVYTILNIGTQKWMGENLRTIHYRNGDLVYNCSDNNSWGKLSYGAFRYHRDDPYKGSENPFYNWYAVMDDRGLAPTGWHIPTYQEFQILINTSNYPTLLKLTFLDEISSVYLKNGWWSSTATNFTNPWCLCITSQGLELSNEMNSRVIGLFVRCIKD